LARRPVKGFALLILVETGSLADEHQVGRWVTDPKNDLGPGVGKPAADTCQRFAFEDA
jgi:hypothetical protein